MAIDQGGRFWKGASFDDLAEYLRIYTADAYPVTRVVQAKCACGGVAFQVEVDDEEGVARRICAGCGAVHVMLDGEEFVDEAHPRAIKCPCRKKRGYEVGVGFSLYEDGEGIRWVTIGLRCVACGVLGSPGDWKIGLAGPEADALFGRV